MAVKAASIADLLNLQGQTKKQGILTRGGINSQTHAVNVLSNTLTSVAQIPEHGVAAAIGQGRRLFKGPEIDRVTFGEVGARATGLLQGTKEGLREFARAFRTGQPSDFVSKVEGQSQKAISGLKGEVIRVPTRLLTAEDELFKAIARRQALAGLAVRRAGQKGLKGEEAKRFASDLVNNPPDALLEEAMDYARYVTFQNKLGPVGSKISAITNDMPILKAVLPFIRTPTNLIKFTVERSPAAPLLREWRKDFAAGGARRDIAIARATVGTGVGAVIAELAAQGYITGSPPSDENKRRLLMADGWQPYSLKIGDRYYSYRRLDPFAMTFGTAADIATLGKLNERAAKIGKGDLVHITGRVRQNSYEAEGTRHYTVDLIADRMATIIKNGGAPADRDDDDQDDNVPF